MQHYQHRQVGIVLLSALGVGVATTAAVLIRAEESPSGAYWIGGSVLVVLALCMVVFHSLNVEVTSNAVTASFGPGWIRKRIALDEIREARVVRNHWYFGWGIRWIPRGWMFNVSGFDAVELEFAQGRKFRIGTDDPEGLLRAISRARQNAA